MATLPANPPCPSSTKPVGASDTQRPPGLRTRASATSRMTASGTDGSDTDWSLIAGSEEKSPLSPPPPMSARACAFSIASLLGHGPPGKLRRLASWTDAAEVPGARCLGACGMREGSDWPAGTGLWDWSIGAEGDPALASPAVPVQPQCILENRSLWRQFKKLGTEMIITRPGRRMFPVVRVSFSDLQPNCSYQVQLEATPVDSNRYRYAYTSSSWVVAGRADSQLQRRCFFHPDGPFSGIQLMRQAIGFEKLKLTNNSAEKRHIVLNSMHKYRIRIGLIRLTQQKPAGGPANCQLLRDCAVPLMSPERLDFNLTETEFIAVTAYQNQLITRLKIDMNPFAKGFRDASRAGNQDSLRCPYEASEQKTRHCLRSGGAPVRSQQGAVLDPSYPAAPIPAALHTHVHGF